MAEFGIIGLETVFALLITHNITLNLHQIIEKLTTKPRQILRLNEVSIQEGNVANLTLFDPDQTWTYSKTLSKSKNSPFLGKEFSGKVVGTVL